MGELTSNLTSLDWFLLSVSGFIIGFEKTGVAGVGILAIPIFAIIFPAEKSAGFLLPILCFGDVIAVSYYRSQADWRKIVPLMPWVAAGLIAATGVYYSGSQKGTVMHELITSYMKPVIGVVVLVALGISLWRERRQGKVSQGRALEVGTGFSAGFISMLANAAGPILSIYLLALKLPKEVFIGTAAWFFLVINGFWS